MNSANGGAIYFFVALPLFLPVLYAFPFLLRMMLRTYGYFTITLLVLLYLIFFGFCVYLLSLGHIFLFFALPFLVDVAAVLRFRQEFVMQVRRSTKSLRDLLGLSSDDEQGH